MIESFVYICTILVTGVAILPVATRGAADARNHQPHVPHFSSDRYVYSVLSIPRSMRVGDQCCGSGAFLSFSVLFCPLDPDSGSGTEKNPDPG